MAFSDYVLYRLARMWPSPMAHRAEKLGEDPTSLEYQNNYAREQFDRRVRDGMGCVVAGKDVLEIGCGHGGISCFLAVAGARKVVGIDLNTPHLKIAENLAEVIARHFGPESHLPVEFVEMNAYEMTFPPESFDVVVAENSFEHFDRPDKVLEQSWRILRPGGRMVVPIFSSIYSAHGLHLKHGIKMPWANLVFSEKTIVRAMHRLAAENPKLYELYPGLANSPESVRDLRRHKDLNDITHRKFQKMAKEVCFEIERFRPIPTRFGRVLDIIPLLRRSFLGDIFSVGASALLRKPLNAKENNSASAMPVAAQA